MCEEIRRTRPYRVRVAGCKSEVNKEKWKKTKNMAPRGRERVGVKVVNCRDKQGGRNSQSRTRFTQGGGAASSDGQTGPLEVSQICRF